MMKRHEEPAQSPKVQWTFQVPLRERASKVPLQVSTLVHMRLHISTFALSYVPYDTKKCPRVQTDKDDRTVLYSSKD